jgi:hypothetical protein
MRGIFCTYNGFATHPAAEGIWSFWWGEEDGCNVFPFPPLFWPGLLPPIMFFLVLAFRSIWMEAERPRGDGGMGEAIVCGQLLCWGQIGRKL